MVIARAVSSVSYGHHVKHRIKYPQKKKRKTPRQRRNSVRRSLLTIKK
jgi:hypothetical protein